MAVTTLNPYADLRYASKAALAELLKVGPKGYIHGWIFVGAPGVGSRVFHPQHGHGTVKRHGKATVTVHFDSGAKHAFEHTRGTGTHTRAGSVAAGGHFAERVDRRRAEHRAPRAGAKPRDSSYSQAGQEAADIRRDAYARLQNLRHHEDEADRAQREGRHADAVNHLTAALGNARDPKAKRRLKERRDALAAEVMGRPLPKPAEKPRKEPKVRMRNGEPIEWDGKTRSEREAARAAAKPAAMTDAERQAAERRVWSGAPIDQEGWKEAGKREAATHGALRDAFGAGAGSEHVDEFLKPRQEAAHRLGAARAERANVERVAEHFDRIANDPAAHPHDREAARAAHASLDKTRAHADEKIRAAEADLARTQGDAGRLGSAALEGDMGSIYRRESDRVQAAHAKLESTLPGQIAERIPESARGQFGYDPHAKLLSHEKRTAAARIAAEERETAAGHLDRLAEQTSDPHAKAAITAMAQERRRSAQFQRDEATLSQSKANAERADLDRKIEAATPKVSPERAAAQAAQDTEAAHRAQVMARLKEDLAARGGLLDRDKAARDAATAERKALGLSQAKIKTLPPAERMAAEGSVRAAEARARHAAVVENNTRQRLVLEHELTRTDHTQATRDTLEQSHRRFVELERQREGLPEYERKHQEARDRWAKASGNTVAAVHAHDPAAARMPDVAKLPTTQGYARPHEDMRPSWRAGTRVTTPDQGLPTSGTIVGEVGGPGGSGFHVVRHDNGRYQSWTPSALQEQPGAGPDRSVASPEQAADAARHEHAATALRHSELLSDEQIAGMSTSHRDAITRRMRELSDPDNPGLNPEDRTRASAVLSRLEAGKAPAPARKPAAPSEPRQSAPERTLERLRDSTDPKDNGAKLAAMFEHAGGRASLHRRTWAGPSGQTRNTHVGDLHYLDDGGAHDFKVTNRDGEHVGYLTRATRNGKSTYAVHSVDYDGGVKLEGWTPSAAAGADWLNRGEYAAFHAGNNFGGPTTSATHEKFDVERSIRESEAAERAAQDREQARRADVAASRAAQETARVSAGQPAENLTHEQRRAVVAAGDRPQDIGVRTNKERVDRIGELTHEQFHALPEHHRQTILNRLREVANSGDTATIASNRTTYGTTIRGAEAPHVGRARELLRSLSETPQQRADRAAAAAARPSKATTSALRWAGEFPRASNAPQRMRAYDKLSPQEWAALAPDVRERIVEQLREEGSPELAESRYPPAVMAWNILRRHGIAA